MMNWIGIGLLSLATLSVAADSAETEREVDERVYTCRQTGEVTYDYPGPDDGDSLWLTNGEPYRGTEMDGPRWVKISSWGHRRPADGDQGFHALYATPTLHCECDRQCRNRGWITLGSPGFFEDRASQKWPLEASHTVSSNVDWIDGEVSETFDGDFVFAEARIVGAMKTCPFLFPSACEALVEPWVSFVPDEASGGYGTQHDGIPISAWITARCPECERFWRIYGDVEGLPSNELPAYVEVSWKNNEGRWVSESVEISPSDSGSKMAYFFAPVVPEPQRGETRRVAARIVTAPGGPTVPGCRSPYSFLHSEDLRLDISCRPLTASAVTSRKPCETIADARE